KLNDLKTLDCHKVPFLIMPPGETFPTDYFEDIVRYVRDGGTLFLTGGVPLYYETKLENGVLEKQEQSASEKWREQLRIGWFAWWTRQGTPEEAPNQPTEETAPLFTHLSTQTQGTRFFDNSRLKEGDKMIPLLLSKKDDFQAPAAVLYRFNSDWKGNLVVSSLTSFGFITNTSTVDNQGVFLPQSYLMAFAAGVEKFFWYEFQATEIDPNEREHYFGIVHKDLSEKPAYIAYRTLTGAMPAGSVQMPGWKQGDCCVIQWRRPDGQNGWALWSPSGEITKKVRISGSVVEAFDYLGQSVSPDVNTETLTLSPKILYLIGPDSIELQ
ncbi:MAG: hypothetical protein IKW74_06180, partial [Thermoguttaceae bacterium]|nr:hypothetical protein [Thermoguttaceae bacterium]